MRINQCHISNSLIYFKEGFKKKWNLAPYHDQYAPTIFAGIYNHQDVSLFNNHKGFKIVLFGGADMPNVTKLKGYYSIVIDEFSWNHRLRHYYSRPIKFIRVAWKDYSDFKPIELGEKIYCYQNQPTVGNKNKYHYNELSKIIEYFGHSQIMVGYQGNTMAELVDKFYSQALVNIQLNPIAGFTTTLEMAHLGRMSISNYPAPFCIPFKNHIDIIAYIRKLKHQHPSPQEVHDMVKDFVVTDDYWLDTNFWK